MLKGWNWIPFVSLLGVSLFSSWLFRSRKINKLNQYLRCEEFAEQDCVVYATSRTVESIEGFKHSGIHRIAVDVTSDEDVQRAVQTVVDAEGRIDVVVCNAGVICIGPCYSRWTYDMKI